MTVLEISPPRSRSLPWPLIRRVVGSVFLLAGIYLLRTAWHDASAQPVALGIMCVTLGMAACISPKSAEAMLLPVGALVMALLMFGAFMEPSAFAELVIKIPALILTGHIAELKAMLDTNHVSHAYTLMYTGAFGSWFSFQNTLTRASPLMLTGLCTALPMRIGLVMIGGEGCLVMGALMAAGSGYYAQSHHYPLWAVVLIMLAIAFLTGGVWLTIAGVLKHYRGVNETISSLLLIYIGIALMNHIVEGPWRDPASLNKPSTWPITTTGDDSGDMVLPPIDIGTWRLPWFGTTHLHMDVHWGLVIGAVACFLCWILMNHTTFGFAARIVGGNVRAAKIAGLSLGKIVIITCMIAGGMAGLAGGIEVAAVQGSANASIIAGYGYTGILVAFLARQNPLAIIPVAILLGGIDASNGLLQRHLHLPDATVRVLQGTIFIMILASETYYGRFKFFQKKEAAHD